MTQRTCLIVDDSALVRQLMTMAVTNVGLSVQEAEDGVIAFANCAISIPDVIFLDLNMPNMDGMEFLKKIRAYNGGDHPKIIMCSVESDSAVIDMAHAAGADDYIVKPFTRNIIADYLRKHGLLLWQ